MASPEQMGSGCCGTVQKRVNDLENALKELHEEIGVSGLPLNEFSKEFYSHERGKRACMWYRLTLDWPIEKFTLQSDEVEQVEWVDNTWLARDLSEHPKNYVPSAQTWAKLFNLKA